MVILTWFYFLVWSWCVDWLGSAIRTAVGLFGCPTWLLACRSFAIGNWWHAQITRSLDGLRRLVRKLSILWCVRHERSPTAFSRYGHIWPILAGVV